MANMICRGLPLTTVLLALVSFTPFALGVTDEISRSSGVKLAGEDSLLGQFHEFAIEPQPLGDALKRFSATTQTSVRWSDADVAEKTSGTVRGNYPVVEALTLLLAGSGMTFERRDAELHIVPATRMSAHVTMHAGPELGKAWAYYHRTLDEMRAKTESAPMFRDPRNRAKAYHALIEAQAMAYNFAIAPRRDNPRIQEATSWQTDFYTVGLTGPDGHYGATFLDGQQTYRMRGRIGAIRLFMLQVFNKLMGSPGSRTTGNFIAAEFAHDANGNFDVILSATKHDGNWIPLDPASRHNWIFVRRIMADWSDDPGELRIEMISNPGPAYYEREEYDETIMAERVTQAADLIRYFVESWNVGLYEMYRASAGGEVNVLKLLPGATLSQVGSPVGNYVNGVYQLADDEALIVELKEPPKTSSYWSFQLSDVWSRALDFMTKQTSINMAHAAIDSDGAFRAVISHRDPGVANWLDTLGHRDGTLVFRNYGSETAPVPTIRRVKYADFSKHLPVDTKRVTPEERQQALRNRKQGLLKLLGE
jgi:hypothetical protein